MQAGVRKLWPNKKGALLEWKVVRDVARYVRMQRMLEGKPDKPRAIRQNMCGTVAAPIEPQGAGALVLRTFLPDSSHAACCEVKWSLCNVPIWHSL